MNGNRVALFGYQLSMVGGFVLVAEGYQFGIFFPFGWTFILIGLIVIVVSRYRIDRTRAVDLENSDNNHYQYHNGELPTRIVLVGRTVTADSATFR